MKCINNDHCLCLLTDGRVGSLVVCPFRNEVYQNDHCLCLLTDGGVGSLVIEVSVVFKWRKECRSYLSCLCVKTETTSCPHTSRFQSCGYKLCSHGSDAWNLPSLGGGALSHNFINTRTLVVTPPSPGH